MPNVYERIEEFYFKMGINVCPQKLVEGFIQEKAWKNKNDEELSNIWIKIAMHILFLTWTGKNFSTEMNVSGWGQIINWLDKNALDFNKNVTQTRIYIQVIKDFTTYLQKKDFIKSSTNWQELTIAISDKQKFDQLTKDTAESANKLPNLPAAIFIHMEDCMHDLVAELGRRVDDKFLLTEFDRAINLYKKSVLLSAEEGVESDDFMLGFWGYFLFVYRTNKYGDRLLLNYIRHNNLSVRYIKTAKKILSSKFLIAYNKKNAGECIDLLTGEGLGVGFSGEANLFLGSYYPDDLLNHPYFYGYTVTSSIAKRIKSNILRLKSYLEILREEKYTEENFLLQYPCVVKYIMEIFVRYDKLEVVPIQEIKKLVAEKPQKEAPLDFMYSLPSLIASRGFSRVTNQNAIRLWNEVVYPLFAEDERYSLDDLLEATCWLLIYLAKNDDDILFYSNPMNYSKEKFRKIRGVYSRVKTHPVFEANFLGYLDEEGLISWITDNNPDILDDEYDEGDDDYEDKDYPDYINDEEE